MAVYRLNAVGCHALQKCFEEIYQLIMTIRKH